VLGWPTLHGMAPQLSGGLDHVHVYVADRDAAADWYARMLGFRVVEKFRSWADDPHGPLTIEDPTGRIHLALFASAKARHDVVAFGASGEEFLEWLAHFEQHDIAVRVVDHGMACSVYFDDADGNGLEITTYEVEPVRAARR